MYVCAFTQAHTFTNYTKCVCTRHAYETAMPTWLFATEI